ncbi:MAG: caspase family protein, partial [Pseudomonadota bacterium]
MTVGRLMAALMTLAALAGASALMPAAAAERRVALVVGNGGYREAPLKNPTNDARAMAAVLRTRG